MLLSLKTNKISFRFRKFLILGFLFCSVIAFNALGQEERTAHHGDAPAEYEEINDHEVRDFSLNGKEHAETKETKISIPKKENKEQLYKHRGEKEVKKEGLSTLSFNLFLYVVDRFKEDN
jgi:hypothetical protein